MKRLASFIKMLFYISVLFMIVGAVTSVGGADNEMATVYAAVGTVAIIALSFTVKTNRTKGIVTNEFLEGLCEKIQTSMIETFKNNAPQMKRTKVGYLQAIKSPQNTSGMTILPIDPGNGKKKLVRITGMVRGCDEDIVDDFEIDECDTEIEKEPWEDTVEITEKIATKVIGFTEDEMRKLCESDDVWMSQVVNSYIDPLMVRLNKRLITNQLANFGAFPDGTNTAHNVTLLTTAPNTAPVYAGEAEILELYEDSDFTGQPIVIGGGKLGTYFRQLGVGCCNDLGLDLSKAGNLDFFRDRYVEGIVGADEFIGLAPGYTQLLTWQKYVGKYQKQNDVFSKGTLVDPFTGIKLDMKWIYDPCTETYALRFFIHFKLYRMPSKAWAYCDEHYGQNGSLRFKALQMP